MQLAMCIKQYWSVYCFKHICAVCGAITSEDKITIMKHYDMKIMHYVWKHRSPCLRILCHQLSKLSTCLVLTASVEISHRSESGLFTNQFDWPGFARNHLTASGLTAGVSADAAAFEAGAASFDELPPKNPPFIPPVDFPATFLVGSMPVVSEIAKQTQPHRPLERRLESPKWYFRPTA